MSEAELLDQVIAVRAQIDVALAQVIALSFAMVIAVYYFLHRSGWRLKVTAFALYAIGWFVFVSSAGFSGQHLVGLLADLGTLTKAGTASAATVHLIDTFSSAGAYAYLIAANGANVALLGGAFWLTFFWRRPTDG